LDQAVEFYTQEIARDPGSWNAYLYRGSVWDLKRDYDSAIADYTRSIRIYPWWATTFNNRGMSWHCKKEYDKAIADYNEAIRLDPKCVLAIVNRGFAHLDKKDYYKALDDFRLAIKVDPKYARPYLARAWLFATCPDRRFRDGKLAVESAIQACDLSSWRDSNKLAVLAAAYAELGDFPKAIRWQTEAIDRAVDPADKVEGRERLELYKHKKPCRLADATALDRENRGDARESSKEDPWSRFPDPEGAKRIFAELEGRVGRLASGAGGREHRPSRGEISSILEIVARKHHLKQSEVRTIWRAGGGPETTDTP
jgi:tetratricopeptide (TPR) repeat protein